MFFNLLAVQIDSLAAVYSKSYVTGPTHNWERLKFSKNRLFCTTHATLNSPGYISFDPDSLSMTHHYETQLSSNGYGYDLEIKNDTVLIANEDFSLGDHFLWYDLNNQLNLNVHIDSLNDGQFGSFDGDKYTVYHSSTIDFSDYNNICESKSYVPFTPGVFELKIGLKKPIAQETQSVDEMPRMIAIESVDHFIVACNNVMHDPLFKNKIHSIYIDLVGRQLPPQPSNNIILTRVIQVDGIRIEYHLCR